MIILVINSGSSSLKYRLINMKDESVLCKGICEKIGSPLGILKHETAGKTHIEEIKIKTHTDALHKALDAMLTGENAVIKDIKEVNAVGHRVAHGGEHFSKSAIINEQTFALIKELSPFAPLHTPFIVKGIESAMEIFGEKVANVAVFDTTFHAEMPKEAYMYALPYEYYEKYGIRRFGFHGTSHKYIAQKCADVLNKPLSGLKIISCHLGNGSSVAAIKNGKSIDTSMGFTPIAGLVMGTRCGDVDVGAILYLQKKLNLSADEISDVLNKKSGLLGLSDVSFDMRELNDECEKNNERAQLAVDVLAYSIKKYIGSYIAAMGGVDALVFTGGIGENNEELRAKICENMKFLGIEINKEENLKKCGGFLDITKANAKAKTFVIATDEELMIARDTKDLLV